MPVEARYRFSNDLRYRDGRDPGNVQITPAYVLAPIKQALGGEIALDPCTELSNPTGASTYYTASDDGLSEPWRIGDWLPSVFVNPPYGKAREPWVDRCIEAGQAGQRVVLLMPAHTDTRIFHAAIGSASSIVFIKGRLKFGILRPNGRQVAASHPSVIVGWNVDLSTCKGLGTVVQMAAISTANGLVSSANGHGNADS